MLSFGSVRMVRLGLFLVGSSVSEAAAAPKRTALYRLVTAALEPADVQRDAYALGVCVAAYVIMLSVF